jgi:hypothetical protein
MSSNKTTLTLAITAVLAGSAGYGLHAFAEGAPTAKPLFYAGTLESNGKLASGAHTIVLTLYDAETAGNQVCVSETPNTPVEAGRFRLEVSADCVAKLKLQPDVWAALKFSGPDGVPHELPVRTKIGAVPFALEAQHAVSAGAASGALTAQIVPAGAVMAFDLDACPAGWAPYVPARGRTVVGVDTGLTRGTAVGNNSVTLSVDNMPAHTHAGTTESGNATGYRKVFMAGQDSFANHTTGWNGAGGYADANDANWPMASHTHNFVTSSVGKGLAVDNRQASVPLLYCRKS